MYILNLSNYEDIGEAIRLECSIETGSTVKQLNDDLEKYIFSKLKESKLSKIEEEEGLNVKKLEISKEDSVITENTSTISVEGGIPVDNYKLKNLLDENFDIKNPRDLVKNIITTENKNTLLSDVASELSSNSKENMKTAEEKIETKLGDVYLERIDAADTLTKKEI